MSFSDKSAIVGIGQTKYVKGTDKTAVHMMLEASISAIADAGLKPSDIDGMVTPPVYTTAAETAGLANGIKTVNGRSVRPQHA